MTSRFIVGRATHADLDAAKRLRLESLRDSPDAFGSLLSETLDHDDGWWESWLLSGATFIARDASTNRDVGIVRVQAMDDLPDEVAMLYSMWVDPVARGEGVGESLVDECVSWARNLGFDEVRLAVVAGNPHAVGLYQRCGFALTGHEEIRERDDALIVEMSRVIALAQTSNE